jgi:hypothetical protein
MKKLIVVYFVIALFADAKADSIPLFRISMEPQYLITNCMKNGFEYRLKENEWLSINTRMIMKEKDLSGSYFNYGSVSLLRVWGAGLDIGYRKYIPMKATGSNEYFIGFTAGYTYCEPVYYRYMWLDYQQDGLNYLTYALGEDRRMIHQPKAELVLGFHFIPVKGMFIDLYSGGGIKYSFFDKYKGDPRTLYNNYWSYGYSGTYLLMNFRIGVEW